MRSVQFCGYVLVSLAVSSVLVPPSLGAESDFTLGAEGWVAVDFDTSLNVPLQVLATHPVSWSAAGGNPDGFISRGDPGPNWFWFSAPGEFLGDQEPAYGSNLSFDSGVTAADGPATTAVILVGNGLTLFYDTLPPDPTWTSFDIPLTPTGWRLNDHIGGVEPSPLEMQSLLGSLDGLYISGDWLTGNEVASLDNVVLIPEPCTAILLVAGLAVAARGRRNLIASRGLSH